ncbi:MAG: hypothetical protein ABW061_26235 [Polyangiaceae bacterium]
MVDEQKPRSAAEPRAGGKPAYIDPNCPKCGSALVLHDSLRTPPTPEDEIWHDEWECPTCLDGIYLDQPATKGSEGANG